MSKIVGKCLQMCPQSEIELRKREGLVNPLERLKKPDESTMVKEFVRSGAGRQTPNASLLRPFKVLVDTVYYLLKDVLSFEEYSWSMKYDFISNRLRAVRQDMIIQDLARQESIILLQPMVRFYAYSHYILSINNIPGLALNGAELQECLKRVLALYDECGLETNWCAENTSSNINYSKLFVEERAAIEAIYILFNLGDGHALSRAVSLPRKWKNTGQLQQALAISLLYGQRNFIRICRYIQRLPHLLAAVAETHLPRLRQMCFAVMSIAYHSQNSSVPLKQLQTDLLYASPEDILQDLKQYNLHYGSDCQSEAADADDDVKVFFIRHKFDATAPIAQTRRESFLSAKLKNHTLTEVILYAM